MTFSGLCWCKMEKGLHCKRICGILPTLECELAERVGKSHSFVLREPGSAEGKHFEDDRTGGVALAGDGRVARIYALRRGIC